MTIKERDLKAVFDYQNQLFKKPKLKKECYEKRRKNNQGALFAHRALHEQECRHQGTTLRDGYGDCGHHGEDGLSVLHTVV